MHEIRVLHVVTYMGRGGIESMLMNYYRNIDRSKLQFDFLVHRDFKADFDDEINRLGGTIHRLPPMNPLSHSYNAALRNFLEAHEYNIIHSHLNYKSGVILSKAKHAGIPVRIAHAHTGGTYRGAQFIIRNLMKLMIPGTSTHRLACSTAAGKAVFGRHDFKLLANAIDAESFRFSPSVRQAVREELRIQDSRLAVIHIGRFGKEKNHEFLIQCFAEIIRSGADAKLILVGDGELREDMEKRAHEILPEDSFVFVGVRSDVNRLLQAADVFAFPSIFEGLPVTLVEAQAAGLPCVKSDNVTDEAAVTDLVTSLPLGDPLLWANEILKKRSIPRRDTYSEIVSSGYDIKSAAKKLQNFYLNGENL